MVVTSGFMSGGTASLTIKENGVTVKTSTISYGESSNVHDPYFTTGGHGGGWLRGTINFPRYVNGSYNAASYSMDIMRFESNVNITFKIYVP